MEMIKNLAGFGFIILLTGFIACEGPTGPQGPQGEPGPQGVEGLQGEQGNANVVADTLTLTNDDWLSGGGLFYLDRGSPIWTGYPNRYVTIDVPHITEDILYAGDIRVYMQNSPTANPGAWVSLPLDFILSDYNIHYVNEIYVGQIKLYYIHTPNNPDATVPSVTNQLIPTRMYRWVVIEGSLISQMEEAKIDLDNYNEVEAFFVDQGIQMKTGLGSN
jgi:hypothetical protein